MNHTLYFYRSGVTGLRIVQFLNKTILLISTEEWGTNMLSKHHYALALAKANNVVFFLNPPSQKYTDIEILSGPENIRIINYSPFIRGTNNFKGILSPLADFFNGIDIKRIKKAIGCSIDVVWNFDPYRFQNFSLFKPALGIFHPVDFIKQPVDLTPARTCDIIFSLAKPILDCYESVSTPRFFINHGLSSVFLENIEVEEKKEDSIIRCGYVGNLLSFAIHYQNFLRIVEENSTIEFHLIGPYASSNLGAYKSSDELKKISGFSNVKLYGEKQPAEVAKLIRTFDLFLVCYHPEKVGAVVSNNHKILEYLSTGKTVVSSFTSTYENDFSDLLEMVKNSEDLPARFKETIQNLAQLNSLQHQTKRKAFASKNSYDKHLKEIESIINTQMLYK